MRQFYIVIASIILFEEVKNVNWKDTSLIFLVTSASLLAMPTVNLAAATTDPVEYWALIVAGRYADVDPQLSANAAYMYHVLHEHYSFNAIWYLSNMPPPNPGVNGSATKQNMRLAINTSLYERSDSNDLIFIFFSGHGGGYNTKEGELDGGRIESPSDEGNEHYIENQWKGVDECLVFNQNASCPDYYWDDEIASDLNYLASGQKYGKLIFVCFSCFSGGMVDDLSAINRIIMTPANETCTAKRINPDGDWFSEWAECFIAALHGEKANWSIQEHTVVHYSPPVYVDADWSNDGNVSMWEAWDYAWKNDYYRQNGNETPWIDDNGNKKPNYVNEAEQLDSYDGLLSMETYFGSQNLKTADINDDAIVNIKDQAIVSKAYGSKPGDPNWNPLADLNNDNKVDVIDHVHVSQQFGKWYPTSSGSSAAQTNADGFESTTSLSLNPNELRAHKGETLSVNVNIADAKDLYAYEFKLYYDKTILTCTDITLPNGHFLEPVNNPEAIYIAKKEFDNDYNATHGQIWIAITLVGNEHDKNGSGTLATITFTAKTKGKTNLTLQDIILVQTTLITPITQP